MDKETEPVSSPGWLPRPGPSVVIVGGGMAGLSAARHLINNGIGRVRILEAKSRLGGRIHTVKHDSGNLDFGAQYIHGEDDNPLYQLAVQNNLIIPTPRPTKAKRSNDSKNVLYDNVFRTDNGNIIPKKIVEDVNEFLEEISGECNGLQDFTTENVSMGEHFERRFEEYLQSSDRQEEDIIKMRGVFDWRMRWELHDNGCRSLYDAAMTKYETYDGEYFIEVEGGFQSILYTLINDIPAECIRINTPVSRINWGDGEFRRCMVETENGEQAECDYVIVTVSLGVLQENMNTLFQPSLPKTRKEAISRSGFGNVVKIFLTWSKPFWNHSFEGIQFVWTRMKDELIDILPKNTPTKKNGDPWYRDIDGFHVLKDNSRTLLGWMGGEGAILSESLDKQQILETCHLFLQTFASDMNISKPDEIHRTQWFSDKYSRGAYIYVSIYNVPEDTLEMSKPLPSREHRHGHRDRPRVLFRGFPTARPLGSHRGRGDGGVSAARHLINNGIGRVRILEAKSRLGGRIHTVQHDSGNLDFGAQYVHGEDDNPLYQLAVQNNIIVPTKATRSSDSKNVLYDNVFRTDNGNIIPKKIVEDVNEFLEEVSGECNGLRDITTENVSMGEHFERRFEEYLQSCDGPEEDIIKMRGVFDWRMRWELHDNGCRSLYDAAFTKYQNYDGEYFIEVEGGFQSILYTLINDIPAECIRINTPVSRINWGDGEFRRCMVETENGEQAECDYVIVTVSLGVLQENMNTLFQPSLPQTRKEAISRSGFGNVVKIFLTWSKPFWNHSFEGIQFVWTRMKDELSDILSKKTPTKKNGDPWYRDIDGFHVLKDNPRTLLGWMGGEGAILSESLDKQQILETCHLLLQTFASDMNVSKPEDIHRTQWLSDKYSRGAFSYISIYNVPKDTLELSKPLPSRENPALLFAGEALSNYHFSTTHGAYETGIQAANVILQKECNKG